MFKKLKKYILNCQYCKVLVGSVLYLFYICSFRLRKNGLNNIVSREEFSLLVKGKILINGNRNIIKLGRNSKIRNVVFEINGHNNKIIISDNVSFYEGGYLLIEGDNCKIRIGKRSTIGSADIFAGESNTSIIIGEDCMFSREIGMNTSDFHSIIDLDSNQRINKPKSINIGNHVWVGNSAFINKGAVIGDGSIVGHRALVPGKVFENNSLIAGMPAKIIKSNINWSREKL